MNQFYRPEPRARFWSVVHQSEIYHKSSPLRGWNGCTFVGADLRRLRLMGALSLTRRTPRGRSGLHSTPGSASTVRTRSRGCSPGVARPVSIGPHFWGSITGDPSIPHSGVRSAGDPIYDKPLTGEPILPSRTANQYLARYWF